MPTQLNQIVTRWTLVNRALGDGETAVSARNELLDRYRGAAWRYFQAVTRDEALAEDLFQEFALRLIGGAFRRADANKGRFRDYLKAVVVHLVKDHYRRSQKRPQPLPLDLTDPAGGASMVSEPNDTFLESWRAELLSRTWSALEQSHATSYAVLRLQANQPEASADEKAQRLSSQQGETFTANRYRVMLHRARQRFSKLLKREVADSLTNPTEEELQHELRQLRLHRYCRE